MMLRHALAVASGLALAVGFASQAAAWQVGNWIGQPVYGNNGFAGCRMSVRYNSGITLHFLQVRNGALFIGMSRPDWRMNPYGTYNMGLVIDGRYVRQARGTVMAGLTNAIFLNLGFDRATRALLQRRFHLTLVNNHQRYNFQLTGTAAALERLEYCVQAGA
jgi:hypothetical protein